MLTKAQIHFSEQRREYIVFFFSHFTSFVQLLGQSDVHTLWTFVNCPLFVLFLMGKKEKYTLLWHPAPVLDFGRHAHPPNTNAQQYT